MKPWVIGVGVGIFALFVISQATASCGGCDSGSNGGDTSSGPSVEYTAADIKYESNADAVIATIDGRNYRKVNNGMAAIGLAYIGKYTGPVLVSDKADAVAFSYNSKKVTEYEEITYEGMKYYYSINEGFMYGNHIDGKKKDIYCCTANTMEGAAEEIIKLMSKEEFAPDTITTVEELKAIANSSENYILGNDIDLSGEEWEPIQGFTGTLMGAGHTISGMTMDIRNVENVGLFGVLEGNVNNLIISSAQIEVGGNAGKAGILAGANKGSIENCTVSGEIKASYYESVGGIVGYNDGGELKNCVNQADVYGGNKVGGIAGTIALNESEEVKNCVNEGYVKGDDSVGGVAGLLTGVKMAKTQTYTLSASENKGEIEGDNNVGGVFGEVYGMYNYENYSSYYCYFELSSFKNAGTINGSSSGENVGGVLGKSERLKTLNVCENTGDVNGGHCVGGIVGYAPGVRLQQSGIENTATITGKGKVGGFAGHTGIIENAINKGEIISNGILIEDSISRAYVGGIAGFCEGLNGCVNEAEIMGYRDGSYVGGLAGYLDLTENGMADDNENKGAVTGSNHVGGIAGYFKTVNIEKQRTYQISNNKNSGIITGKDYVGGIFGEAFGTYYYSSYTSYYGHLEISDFINTAEIIGSATGQYTGGLIGHATRIVTLGSCENTADVTGGDYVGGYLGYAPNANIQATGAENENTITGNTYVGGFAGYAGLVQSAINYGQVISVARNAQGETYLGGIVGYCTGMIDCENNVDITVENAGKYVGGIAGYVLMAKDGVLKDNKNNGEIKGAENTGGIAGYVQMPQEERSNEDYTITNNENTKAITGTTKVGGIFGEVLGREAYLSYTWYKAKIVIANCSNEGEIIGTESVGGIVGLCKYMKTDANIMETNSNYWSGDKIGTVVGS